MSFFITPVIDVLISSEQGPPGPPGPPGEAETSVVSLSDSDNDVVLNAQGQSNFSIRLTKNHVLLNPVNLGDGRLIRIACTQDSVGKRLLTYDTSYRFPKGAAALSTEAGALDLIVCYYDGAYLLCTLYKGFAAPVAYTPGTFDFSAMQASGLIALI